MLKISGYVEDKQLKQLDQWNALVEKIGKTDEERADQDALTFELACWFNGMVKTSISMDKINEVHDGKE